MFVGVFMVKSNSLFEHSFDYGWYVRQIMKIFQIIDLVVVNLCIFFTWSFYLWFSEQETDNSITSVYQ